jgi:glutamate/tyrosine decarboxylase-like PLP-dependent enzyme
MAATQRLATEIESIRGLEVVQPHDLSILLFGSDEVDIFAVADRMVDKGWFVGRSVNPKAIHLAVNPLVAPAVDEYLTDLSACVAHVRRTGETGTASIDTY